MKAARQNAGAGRWRFSSDPGRPLNVMQSQAPGRSWRKILNVEA
jgi:hypothetical protein